MRWLSEGSSLGAGNVPFWLGERGDDLAKPRLWLDRAWVAPGGESKDSLGLGDILAAAGAYRKMYRELGVQAGDVVVTRIRTPIDVYLHWVALAAEGAIAAPVNSNLPDDGVDRYARRIAALGCLVENDAADCEPGTLTWRSSKTGEAATVVAAALRGAVDEPAYAHRPEDIVLLCHTSGTTGDPKAVSCSHHGFMVGILDQEDGRKCPLFGVSMLNALPPGHHSWLKTIVWALVSGTKLILANDQSARTLLDDVERFEPDSIRSFSCTLREVARLDLPPGSLRSVGLWMTTGDASPSRDIAAVAALGTRPVAGPDGVTRVPGMLVLDGFGSTELGHQHFSILHVPGKLNDARCIGRPTSFAAAAILDEDGRELPDGEIGYLAVRSDAVTPGYWNDPERTESSRRGGFWITGDVGYRDAFGRYFHLDRHSDVIETPHGAVYSVRCEEELLRSLPGIERCAVVGRRNDDGVVRVVCLLEPRDDARERSSWHEDVNAALAAASLPRVAETIVLPRGTLPLGPTGKIRKFLVRADGEPRTSASA